MKLTSSLHRVIIILFRSSHSSDTVPEITVTFRKQPCTLGMKLH